MRDLKVHRFKYFFYVNTKLLTSSLLFLCFFNAVLHYHFSYIYLFSFKIVFIFIYYLFGIFLSYKKICISLVRSCSHLYHIRCMFSASYVGLPNCRHNPFLLSSVAYGECPREVALLQIMLSTTLSCGQSDLMRPIEVFAARLELQLDHFSTIFENFSVRLESRSRRFEQMHFQEKVFCKDYSTKSKYIRTAQICSPRGHLNFQ